MNESEAIAIIAEAVEVDPASLTAQTRISDVEDWSSISWLTLMSLVDEKFNAQLSAKEIKSFTTVGDVVAFLQAKAVAA
jgi:acyl carrier protein